MTHHAEDNVAERGTVAFAQRMGQTIALPPTTDDQRKFIAGLVLTTGSYDPSYMVRGQTPEEVEARLRHQPTQPWNGYDRRITHAHGDRALVMGQGGVREI